MRDVKGTKVTLASSDVGFSPDIWTRQLQEWIQYADVQVSGTIEALDQILAVAIERGSMMDSQATEAAEVLDIARDAVVHVVYGIDELAAAFKRARDLLLL